MYCVYLSLEIDLLVFLDFNEIKSKDPGDYLPRFESWLGQLPVMETWGSYIASQCPSFRIYKDGDSNSTYPLGLF